MFARVTSVEQQIIDGVAKSGWFSITYRPGPDDPQEWYGYTVGLTETARWPEVICLGLDGQVTVGMLRNMIGECWTRSEAPAAGLELHQVIEGRLARLAPFKSSAKRYFLWADWFADRSGNQSDAERLQLIWPDSQGRFPDDPDCDPRIRELQTPKVAA